MVLGKIASMLANPRIVLGRLIYYRTQLPVLCYCGTEVGLGFFLDSMVVCRVDILEIHRTCAPTVFRPSVGSMGVASH